jgi:hypothetical protein
MTHVNIGSNITISSELVISDDMLWYIKESRNIKILWEWLSLTQNSLLVTNGINKILDFNGGQINWIAYYWWECNLIFEIESITKKVSDLIK